MDKGRISRLINFEGEGMDTSTGYVDMRPDVDISEYLMIMEKIRECIESKSCVGWIENTELFTRKFCEEFGSFAEYEGGDLLVYEYAPRPELMFYETPSWKEPIKGLWYDLSEDKHHENVGMVLDYHKSSEPYYKRFYPVLDYVNRDFPHAWKNTQTIYEYFKLILKHIRTYG